MKAAGNKIARPAVSYRMRIAPKPDLRLLPASNALPRMPQASVSSLAAPENRDEFQRIFLPHLDGAYNLARWLLKNDSDAQDVVQDAYLRALRFFESFRGGDPRAWLFTIVRNCAYTWMNRNRVGDAPIFDEEQHPIETVPVDIEIIRKAESRAVHLAMEQLPAEFREVVVLRDLEGLSYKEIAQIADLPIGTVMSRLARARSRLKAALLKQSSAGGAS